MRKNRAQGVRPRAVMDEISLPQALDQAGLLEHLEVMAQVGCRDL
jgi:hypothetical protein